MANRTLTGARWKQSLIAPAASSPPIEVLPIASGYNTDIFVGDFVKILSTGYVSRASAGDTLYGVFAGCEQYYDGSKIVRGGKYPANTAYGTVFERQTFARIIPAFGQVFEMDADDATTATTYAANLALVGENAEWITGTGTGDNSGNLLDISTHANTNTLSLRLHGLSKHVDIDYAAVGVKYYVTVNLVEKPAGGSTTGQS